MEHAKALNLHYKFSCIALGIVAKYEIISWESLIIKFVRGKPLSKLFTENVKHLNKAARAICLRNVSSSMIQRLLKACIKHSRGNEQGLQTRRDV